MRNKKLSRDQSLAVIVPCWGARHEFRESLSLNWRSLRHAVAEYVVVTSERDGDSIRDVIASVTGTDQTAGGVRLIAWPSDRSLTKGRLLNLGVSESSSELVLCLDCDIVLPEQTLVQMKNASTAGTVAHLARLIREGSESTNRINLESVRDVLEVRMTDGRMACVERSSFYPAKAARGGPGIVCVRRENFVSVGGYNGALEGYGWEDVDLLIRLALVTGCQVHPVGEAFDLVPQAARSDLDDRLASESRNYQVCIANYCLGLLSGTLYEDATQSL